jgi:two-component system NtrC family response regulator
MAAYDWPGNMRELKSRVKRGVIMADNSQMTAEGIDLFSSDPSLKIVREMAENTAVAHGMSQNKGNVSEAANALGVSRPTIYKVLERMGMKH